MANEKRLIDAKELIHRIVAERDAVEIKTGCDIGYHNGLNMAVSMAINAPTVEAVEVAGVREFAEDVVYQFGYYCQNGGRLHITHGGLSTLEWAFDILGWENPHPVPECECEIDGCHEHATCGTPTADGYKRVCGKHFHSISHERDKNKNL